MVELNVGMPVVIGSSLRIQADQNMVDRKTAWLIELTWSHAASGRRNDLVLIGPKKSAGLVPGEPGSPRAVGGSPRNGSQFEGGSSVPIFEVRIEKSINASSYLRPRSTLQDEVSNV
jgi:hypothetical protein